MKKTDDRKPFAIVVLSCDKYADLWAPFFSLFQKNWPDCPYDVYLGSNTVFYRDKSIKTILSGPDKDWSSSLLAILSQISAPYIFLWLDDIFPIHPIDADKFSKGFAFMKKTQAAHIHTHPIPVPDGLSSDRGFGTYPKGMPYRIHVLGFWNVAKLRSILLKGENPWNFEIMGSYRSSYMDGFYCTMTPLFQYVHVVEKGLLLPKAVSYCKKHQVPLQTKERSVLKEWGYVRSIMQVWIFENLMRIPWRIRVSMMNILRKIFISY